MVALFSLLSIVAISILVVRIATKALELTGLESEAAAFQARSAFTGTGFTTEEAEGVVRHPVRRRIVTALMWLQSVGLVTAISTLVLSFVDTGSTSEALRRGGLLVSGLLPLALAARSRWVEQFLERVIDWSLRRYTNLEIKDYYTLLNLEEEYSVGRFRVNEGTWLAGRRLRETDLPAEGVLVLGIIRADGDYVGAPRGRYEIRGGDTLVLYGKQDKLSELEDRLAGASGEAAHERGRQEHERQLRQQDRQEAERERRRDAASAEETVEEQETPAEA